MLHYIKSQNILKRAHFDERDVSIYPVTLVHCEAGKSRSVSLVLAFVMWLRRWTLEQSLSYLKDVIRTSQFTSDFSLSSGCCADPVTSRSPSSECNLSPVGQRSSQGGQPAAKTTSLDIAPNLNFLGQLLMYQDRLSLSD